MSFYLFFRPKMSVCHNLFLFLAQSVCPSVFICLSVCRNLCLQEAVLLSLVPVTYSSPLIGRAWGGGRLAGNRGNLQARGQDHLYLIYLAQILHTEHSIHSLLPGRFTRSCLGGKNWRMDYQSWVHATIVATIWHGSMAAKWSPIAKPLSTVLKFHFWLRGTICFVFYQVR